MKFKAQFAAPRVDLGAYRQALDKAMREAISQALMEWLNRILEEIPDWSGASRATFMKLGQAIGMSIPISPTPNALVHVGNRVGEGEASSAGSKLSINEPPHCYTFTYKTNLPWLIWNEYHNANTDPDETKWPPPAKLLKPGPYNAIGPDRGTVGVLAFLQFAKSVDLPAVRPFIKGVKIKL